MSELRTDFKDEILQEGETHRVYDIKRKGTDEIVESDIYLEKAYTPLQEGNEFGAKEVNEIHGRLNGLAPQNLLINGDFKINQRGQSSYEINNSTWIYSIDLWRINGMKLQVNGDGTITLTALNEANYFQQIVENANYQTGDKLVLSLYIDGSIKVFNIQIGTTDYVDEKISIFASYNEEQKKIYLSLSLNQKSNSITLKWIRLNEGSIVYPHVEEDKTIASLRCKAYLKLINLSMSSYDMRGENVLMPVVVNLDVDFIDKPTFVQVEAGISVNVQKIDIETFKNNIRFKVFSSANGFVRVENAVYLFSCEPL